MPKNEAPDLIAVLETDHRQVSQLMDDIENAEGDRRSDLVRQLAQALEVHMQLEEDHVYALLASEVDADLAEEANVEHRLARQGLEELRELEPDQPGFDGALAMVRAGIEHHVEEEESEAFPGLRRSLDEDRLRRLGEELGARREELLSGWDDHGGDRPRGKLRSTRGQAGGRQRAKGGSVSPDTPISPDETTKADLVAQAKEQGISGYSKMTKDELANALSHAAER